MDRAQRKGRGQNPSREGAGTAQTPASGHAVFAVPASAVRLGAEGATEELGAGAGTQTPQAHRRRAPLLRAEAPRRPVSGASTRCRTTILLFHSWLPSRQL